MAGPIDTRINPTKVNELNQTKPKEWFERNLIADVPASFQGARRKVCPGFMQLAVLRHGFETSDCACSGGQA
jgi:poly-beta-hydroxyalkanoate depolymerase